MAVHAFDLQVAAWLQEKNVLKLEDCESLFGKSASSVKRSIAEINAFLPEEQYIRIDDNQAVCHLSYMEYIRFIQSLTLDDYYSSQKERVTIMVIYSFFNFQLNTARLYESLHISMTTKKKDSRELSLYLKEQSLETRVIPKKGIEIIGEEESFRMLACTILAKYVEVGEEFELVLRKANNPWQRMIAEYFLIKTDNEITEARQLMETVREEFQLRIAYTSLKFLYLYLICTLYRGRNGHKLSSLKELSLEVTHYHILPDAVESEYLDRMISSLDFTSHVMPPVNVGLKNLSEKLIEDVQAKIITRIADDRHIHEEVYAYLHKCILRTTYHVSFYDNKLEETKQLYNNLYEVIAGSVGKLEHFYGIRLTHFQIASLTLIFRKFVEKNKKAGRNSKRIVIITNSAREKIGFFIEQMKLYVDISKAELLHINELYLLKDQPYDYLIVFSNRIAMMVEEMGYPCLKLHFYLTHEDIEKLYHAGFSIAKRKLKAEEFVKELMGVPEEQRKDYLLERYEDFFIE